MIETENTWYAYEGGATISEAGFDGGMILRDEEYGDPTDEEVADVRLTLERGGKGIESRRLTLNVYGWMQSARDFATEAEANAAFDTLKTELVRVAGMIPDEDDRDVREAVARLNESIAQINARYALREDL